MANAQPVPVWKRWWIWCAGCLVLAGVIISEQKQIHDFETAAGIRQPGASDSDSAKASPDLESAPPSGDASSPGVTTGDPQIDAFLADEIRRWLEDFGFDAEVRRSSLRAAIHAFRPFLLFAGGRESIQEACRLAHDDAARTRRRLIAADLGYGQAGREDTLRRGTYVRSALEAAAADWLDEKTIENVDAEVPEGGWTPPTPGALHMAHGNIVNASGRLVWAGRPDLSGEINSQMTAEFMQWADEFDLSEDDLPALSRVVLTRLLLLSPAPSGEGPNSAVRARVCEGGIKWLHGARDNVRPLFRRTGWVNLPRLVRLSTEAAAHDSTISSDGPQVASFSQVGEKPITSVRTASASLIAQGQMKLPLLRSPFDEAAVKKLRASWAECIKMPGELASSIGMKLVLIPPGEFAMGSTPEQMKQARELDRKLLRDGDHAEEPQHAVRITRPFYMGAHEVTRGEFAAFVRATGYQTEASRDGKGGFGFNEGTGQIKQDPQYDWRNTGFVQSDSEPVVNVSWNDASAFCQWMSGMERATCRLPTEGEWEYCCRAGTNTLFFCGDDPEGLAAVANVADAMAKTKFPKWRTINGRDGYVFTAPVGSFPANAFGLTDMHGNVWEWCGDWYSSDYYAQSPRNDPPGPPHGSLRVFRGGSWYDSPGLCRCAFRFWDIPTYRDYFLGFRVVLVPAVE